MNLVHRTFIALAATAALLLSASLARADVRDNAKIFSPDTVDKANAAMAQMQQKHNRSFVVETFPAIPDDLKTQYQQQGKDAFYREWLASRARALQVNGVYALVSMDPRHVEVEAGKNTKAGGAFTNADVTRLSQQIIAAFKQQQFDAGLLQAVDSVERAYTANISGGVRANSAVGGAAAPAQNQPAGKSSSPWPGKGSGSRIGIGSLICLGIGVLLVVSLVRSVLRNRANAGAGYGAGGANYGGGPNPNNPGGPGYGQPGYGQGYGGGGGGGGFGRGMLGGLFGGMLGGYAADRFLHRNDQTGSGGGDASHPTQTGGIGGGSSGWDAGPSDAGEGFGSSSSGGDFGGGGGGDMGGGGDSGGGGGDF